MPPANIRTSAWLNFNSSFHPFTQLIRILSAHEYTILVATDRQDVPAVILSVLFLTLLLHVILTRDEHIDMIYFSFFTQGRLQRAVAQSVSYFS